ncbi:MAG TPA: hypothetical protein GX405_02385 [Rhizobiales bacterium]|nr:hypothetical protein [Hyphomicrobiales bacterium]
MCFIAAMSKKPAKGTPAKGKAAAKVPAGADAVPAEGEAAAKPKRSKLKLALFASAPLLLLGGGGYAGWTFLLAPAEAARGGHDGEGSHDGTVTSPLLPDPRPEVSATHSYAIAVIMEPVCGAPPVPALKAASEAEAAADGAMVNQSWIAAVRRTRTLDAKNCSYLWTEVEGAEWRAAEGAAPAKAAAHH